MFKLKNHLTLIILFFPFNDFTDNDLNYFKKKIIFSFILIYLVTNLIIKKFQIIIMK